MALLEFLQKNKEGARKIFGERELKIIQKQLFGLKLKQSERNRLSRDIRKKLEFIDKVSRYREEFGLKHGAKIKEIVEKAKADILNSKYLSRVKRIILFGSTTENIRHLGSDIDIAVEFDKIDPKEAMEFRMKIGHSDMLDIQVYNVLPDKVKKEIQEKGEVVYERKNR